MEYETVGQLSADEMWLVGSQFRTHNSMYFYSTSKMRSACYSKHSFTKYARDINGTGIFGQNFIFGT